jgi:hypothetical protein
VTSKDLIVHFINEEKLNVSIHHHKFNEMLNSGILTNVKCYSCNKKANALSEECNGECFISSFANYW